MTKKKPPSLPEPFRTRRRDVTTEEASLWADVTSSLKPFKGKVRARSYDPGPEIADGAARREAAPAIRARPSEPMVPLRPLPVPEPARSAEPAPLSSFDRRSARQIASGKVEIDARLDLHGLRQDEARHRLVGFIRSCHGRGLRTVLVITGKGSSGPVDPLARVMGEPQRGVLRRLVPQLLDGPDLRPLVISFSTASARHGGDGALYVRLRRADRV